ncbi:Radical SAM superfamily enzyme YgiQ, UPF0313 family [Duganella sp. CF458]|nr:Radical SAM superfamily enzyme YgiQ, UPF0313 family [Duganella sp. CF458]
MTAPGKAVSLIRKAAPRPERQSLGARRQTLCDALALAGLDGDTGALADRLLQLQLAPPAMAQALRQALGERVHWVHVTGTLEDRLLLLATAAHGGIACSLGAPLAALSAPPGSPLLQLEHLLSPCLARFSCSQRQQHRLGFPQVALVALYHPEQFPLPRFPLGISDMARALRKQKLGTVSLHDMQFGHSAPAIVAALLRERPDIIGISITFGQHDLLEQILAGLAAEPAYQPLLVLGGSLAALNYDMLLRTLPVHFVATGPGERTMQDVVAHWHGDLARDEIVDVAYLEQAAVRRTRRINNRQYDDIHPELDLLEATLAHGGVMQLESSRGCSYACSFCPREHKGIWSGDDAAAIASLLPEIDAVYRKFPEVDRRIFLVDEEFVGYAMEEQAQQRCLRFGQALRAHGFRYETSSRVDQVCRPSKDAAWHANRMRFWTGLRQAGLDRCLFGVESGVDSILQRFNKKTTAAQNVLALRILTSLALPIRCTYITFDPLMSFAELLATFAFLGRRDVLMQPSSLPYEQLFQRLSDPAHVAQHQAGVPFYRMVSYMLVSMEGLIGSPYLQMAEQAGLAHALNPLMGRRELAFRDARVGAISQACQLWVDRNFSLDYLLKSIEKVADSNARQQVRQLRLLLKDAAYELLALCLAAFEPPVLQQVPRWQVLQPTALPAAPLAGSAATAPLLQAILEQAFADLLPAVQASCQALYGSIPARFQQPIREQLQQWSSRNEWRLINGQ